MKNLGHFYYSTEITEVHNINKFENYFGPQKINAKINLWDLYCYSAINTIEPQLWL